MPIPQELPDAGDALWQEILAVLGGTLPGILKDHLDFADCDEVAALVLIQLRHRKPPREELEQWLAERPAERAPYPDWLQAKARQLATHEAKAAYVQDCDGVAEYAAPRTTRQRRAAIGQAFCLRVTGPIQYYVEVLLEGRGRSTPGSALTERLGGKVTAKLFAEPEFGRVVASYAPRGGRAFGRYLLRKAFWLCQDVLDEFFEKEPPTESLEGRVSPRESDDGVGRSLVDVVPDPVALAPGETVNPIEEVEAEAISMSFLRLDPLPPSEDEEELMQSPQDALRDLLAGLQDQQPGFRRLALVYLYYKAYVEPEIIPPVVVNQVRDGPRVLPEDYKRTQQILEGIRCEFLEAAAKLKASSSQLRRKGEEMWMRFGQGASEWLELECIARKSTIGELEEEQASLDGAREEQWAAQVDYMLGWKRHYNARRTYEKWCGELRAYLAYKKPWVRSQKELACLLETPQGTIGRELAEVRKWLRGDPIQ